MSTDSGIIFAGERKSGSRPRNATSTGRAWEHEGVAKFLSELLGFIPRLALHLHKRNVEMWERSVSENGGCEPSAHGQDEYLDVQHRHNTQSCQLSNCKNLFWECSRGKMDPIITGFRVRDIRWPTSLDNIGSVGHSI